MDGFYGLNKSKFAKVDRDHCDEYGVRGASSADAVTAVFLSSPAYVISVLFLIT